MKWHLVFRFKRATPSDPPKGSPGGARGGIPQIIMCYVNFGVFNSGKSKNDLYFHIRVTPTPARAPSGGGLGGLQGVLSPILPNIMCYVNSGVLNSGKAKNDLHFHFWVPQPPQGHPQGGGRLGGIKACLRDSPRQEIHWCIPILLCTQQHLTKLKLWMRCWKVYLNWVFLFYMLFKDEKTWRSLIINM